MIKKKIKMAAMTAAILSSVGMASSAVAADDDL